jgi:gamma-glutamylcyclotransferase (GGCT)/AIG2-like uncharacterized protein YtfP
MSLPPPAERLQLVFAFGSNLDEAQLARRCPDSSLVGPARLDGHALAFGGHSERWGGAVATVVRRAGAHVDGALYSVSTTDLERLDRFEGVPGLYERHHSALVDRSGHRRLAAYYRLATGVRLDGVPSPAYLAVLRAGYARFGFDLEPLAQAVSDAAAVQARSRRRIFVYGTLLSGEPNHRLLTEARYVGEAATETGFALYDLGAYPGMVQTESGQVEGELYEVDAATLDRLDALEGHPHLYRRSPVTLASAERAEAYLLTAEQVAGRPQLRTGRWRDRGATATVTERALAIKNRG